MPLNQNKKRIDWIDMAKGYGMIAVIISHICHGPLHLWIYTFHMPLLLRTFVIRWGLCFITTLTKES